MKKLVLICLLGPFTACNGSAEPPKASASDTQEVRSVCSLTEVSTLKDGKRVHLRGRMRSDAHDVFLTGQKCEDIVLILKAIAHGPEVTLCEPEALAKKFGCPGGNENGPVVTVSGVLKASANPKVAAILVESMSDIRSLAEEPSQ